MKQKNVWLTIRVGEDEMREWKGKSGGHMSKWVRDVLNGWNHPIVEKLHHIQEEIDMRVVETRMDQLEITEEMVEKATRLISKRGQCRGCSKVKDLSMRESDVGEKSWLCEECYGKGVKE